MGKQLKIGLVGIGVMGTAICTRLLDVGHRLQICGRNPEKLAAMGEKGAVLCDTPADAASSVDFVIMSLNHADIVREVVFGPNGVASARNGPDLLIDMSSIDPIATAEMSRRLAAGHGMRWLDCPLSGGAPKALSGTLTIMAGGTPEDFEHGREVMQYLAGNYSLMGPSGAGQTVKLINQLFCATAFQATAEAVKLAEAGGVDPALLPAALRGGRADNAIMQEFMAKFAARDYSPTSRIDNMLKDLDSLQSFALSTRTPLPMTGAVVEIHRLLVAAGLGPKDTVEMIKLLDGEI